MTVELSKVKKHKHDKKQKKEQKKLAKLEKKQRKEQKKLEKLEKKKKKQEKKDRKAQLKQEKKDRKVQSKQEKKDRTAQSKQEKKDQTAQSEQEKKLKSETSKPTSTITATTTASSSVQKPSTKTSKRHKDIPQDLVLPDEIPVPQNAENSEPYQNSVIEAWRAFKPLVPKISYKHSVNHLITYARSLVCRTRLYKYDITPEERAEIFACRYYPDHVIERIVQETGIQPIRGKTSEEERALLTKCMKDYCVEFGYTEQQVSNWFYTMDPSQKDPDQAKRTSHFIISVGRKFGGRTVKALYLMYKRILHPLHKIGPFTLEMDQQLVQLQARYGHDWRTIGRQIGRSGFVCRDRFRRLEETLCNFSDGPWSLEEMRLLEEAVRNYRETTADTEKGNYISWQFVSEHVKTRSSFQCMRKWITVINGLLQLQQPKRWRGSRREHAPDHQSWTDSDRFLLCRALMEGGWTSEEEIYWQQVEEFCQDPPTYWSKKNELPQLSQPRSAIELRRQWLQLRSYAPNGLDFEGKLFHVFSMLRFNQTASDTCKAICEAVKSGDFSLSVKNAGEASKVRTYMLRAYDEEFKEVKRELFVLASPSGGRIVTLKELAIGEDPRWGEPVSKTLKRKLESESEDDEDEKAPL